MTIVSTEERRPLLVTLKILDSHRLWSTGGRQGGQLDGARGAGPVPQAHTVFTTSLTPTFLEGPKPPFTMTPVTALSLLLLQAGVSSEPSTLNIVLLGLHNTPVKKTRPPLFYRLQMREVLAMAQSSCW